MSTNNVGSVLVVGYGKMGFHYLREILAWGVAPGQVMVFDVSADRRNVCRKDHPEVVVVDSLEEALEKGPKTAFVIVNSPAHLGVLRRLYDTGVRHVFCEKPVVLAEHLPYLDELEFETFIVSYLINFSQAVSRLMEYMTTNDLHVIHAQSSWWKDRSKDRRPTGGALEDELTHPFELISMLTRLSGDITSMEVVAALAYVPFVLEAAQSAAHAEDESFPLEPVSTASVSVRLHVNRSIMSVPVFLASSFVAFEQRREVTVLLARRGEAKPYAKALLSFDVDGTDSIRVGVMGDMSPSPLSYPSDTKLRDQTRAFLDLVAHDKIDYRLTAVEDGIQAVCMSAAALRADSRSRA